MRWKLKDVLTEERTEVITELPLLALRNYMPCDLCCAFEIYIDPEFVIRNSRKRIYLVDRLWAVCDDFLKLL